MCLHASAPRPTTCTQPSNTHLVMAQPQITSILVWQTNGTPSPEHMGGESKREGATEGKYEDETEHARVCINDPRVKRRLWISWEFCADLVLMWSSRKRLIRLYRRFSNSPHDFIPGFESVYFGVIRINSQKKGECVPACLAGCLSSDRRPQKSVSPHVTWWHALIHQHISTTVLIKSTERERWEWIIQNTWASDALTHIYRMFELKAEASIHH